MGPGAHWVGKTLDGQVRIDELIGEGGMSAVFRAHHLELDRTVVVKVLRNGSQNPKRIVRFRREAMLLGDLTHPNIVRVFGSGETDDGDPYLVMEYLDGQTLKQRLAKWAPLPKAEALHIAGQIGQALQEAHAKDIVHRDLTPSNIVLTPGEGQLNAHVLDFGIATLTASSPSKVNLTEPGTRLGSMYYMSPEQIAGDPVDARTDLYTLGILLLEMVTGERHAVPDDGPKLIARYPDLDPSLSALLEKMLRRKQSARYQPADDLVEAISRAALGESSRRSPAVVVATAVAVVALVGLLLWVVL